MSTARRHMSFSLYLQSAIHVSPQREISVQGLQLTIAGLMPQERAICYHILSGVSFIVFVWSSVRKRLALVLILIISFFLSPPSSGLSGRPAGSIFLIFLIFIFVCLEWQLYGHVRYWLLAPEIGWFDIHPAKYFGTVLHRLSNMLEKKFWVWSHYWEM